jgi:hypothetical protein
VAKYELLESPAEFKARLQKMITWSTPVKRTLQSVDRHANKRKAKTPETYKEYVLSADFSLYFNVPTHDPKRPFTAVELVVPACAEVTVYKPFRSWKPAKVAEAQEKAAAAASKRGVPVIRKAQVDRTHVLFIKFARDGVDTLISVYADNEVRKTDIPVRRTG